MEQLIVIVEIITAVGLSYVYYKLCSGRKMKTSAKALESLTMYSLNILFLFDKIKFWVLILGFAIMGAIKFLTTKRENIERRNKRLIG